MKTKICFKITTASLLLVAMASTSLPQSLSEQDSLGVVLTNKTNAPAQTTQLVSSYGQFIDPVDGLTPDELVRYALNHNGELAAAKQMIAEARGRLRQAGLRPNPMVEVSGSQAVTTRD